MILIDDRQHDLGPLTDLRALADLRTGAYTNLGRIAHALPGEPPTALLVPDHLAEATRAQHEGLPINPTDLTPHLHRDATLLINSALTLIDPSLAERIGRLRAGEAITDPAGRVVAARLDTAAATAFLADSCFVLPDSVEPHVLESTPLVARPWDVIAQLEDILRLDLATIDLPAFVPNHPLMHRIGSHDVKVAPTAKLHPMVVLNSEKGPIVIDDHAIVGSFSVIAGPCYIGPHCIIAPHAHIRANTAFGPHCVLGGEISQTVIQGRSNKCHEGYLGHSYVGEWVNLGAGTSVSNLKNTYGHVRVQLAPDAAPQDSGQIKQGPIIGDFVRTAIGSRIMTGSVVGTASMIAVSGYAPKSIAPLTFLTDQGATPYNLAKLVDTLNKAMSRRGQALHPAIEKRLAELQV